jgi:FlaA1/EpsC-like NDP-sugar epimerase
MIDPDDDRLHERLLGRTTRDVLSARDRRAFAGSRVIVTGGGGSIGAALALEIARCGPSRLTILEQSEHDLVTIERVLSERRPDVRLEGVLGDVSRRRSVDITFIPGRQYR